MSTSGVKQRKPKLQDHLKGAKMYTKMELAHKVLEDLTNNQSRDLLKQQNRESKKLFKLFCAE